MKKLWSGRFNAGVAASVEGFTESISFDKRLWPYDIEGTIAHVKMLQKQRIITEPEAQAILIGLEEIAEDISSGRFIFKQELEDIHMNIETALIEKVGDAGRKVHTARSRNDQVALDIRLYLRDETREVSRRIEAFIDTLVDISEGHIDTIMPGYTHMQRAQPVCLAQHLLAYAQMLVRDRERFEDALKRIDTLPLGACALAGTTLDIDRGYVAKLLGFGRIADNSMDAVSDRDFVVEFISDAAVVMMHLSRMAEEIVLWSSVEFGFIEISDAFTTGSSIMPQKKNPDVAELIRGKTARLYGSLMSILTLMKALPMTYNRDMQEDKVALFDAVDTVKVSLEIINEMMHNVVFNNVRMYETAAGGFSLATDLAEYLVRKGVPFRSAHEITGRIVRHCIDNNKKELSELTLEQFHGFSPQIEADIYNALTLEISIANKRAYGGTSPQEIKSQIDRLRKLRKETH
ncbi:MAG: argininosuccinate lyase [Nitrospirae bacterium]|uniref:argininosuccinate lyase n=1 Tax=Candidatus Magnetobacterium casense TaxID=1455061 RepID=UPI000590ACE1|nr:argininosuccinate lyase [Candidatus Magnetobacterium casensis]MBF0339194.1 argininosuccinate lyase [Nitrospirota bacterium]